MYRNPVLESTTGWLNESEFWGLTGFGSGGGAKMVWEVKVSPPSLEIPNRSCVPVFWKLVQVTYTFCGRLSLYKPVHRPFPEQILIAPVRSLRPFARRRTRPIAWREYAARRGRALSPTRQTRTASLRSKDCPLRYPDPSLCVKRYYLIETGSARDRAGLILRI